jgi:hypothetical protein
MRESSHSRRSAEISERADTPKFVRKAGRLAAGSRYGEPSELVLCYGDDRTPKPLGLKTLRSCSGGQTDLMDAEIGHRLSFSEPTVAASRRIPSFEPLG